MNSADENEYTVVSDGDYCAFMDSLFESDFRMSADEAVHELFDEIRKDKSASLELKSLAKECVAKYSRYSRMARLYNTKAENRCDTFQQLLDEGGVSEADIVAFPDIFRKCDLSRFYEEWNKQKMNLILNDSYSCVKTSTGIPEFKECDTYLGKCRCGEMHDLYSWPEYYRFDVLLNVKLTHESDETSLEYFNENSNAVDG